METKLKAIDFDIPLIPLIRTFARVIGPMKSFRLLVMHLEQQLSIAMRNESLSYRTGVL